jgi:hypothetical protein
MKRIRKGLSLLLMLALCGCAVLPRGPSVMVLPAPGKPFELFQSEDVSCRQWAARQIGMTPQEISDSNMISGAAIGTLVGAGIGAALGAASGHAGTGAAIGAGSGLLLGTATGAEGSRVYGYEAQRRYDIVYMQCMYANGNQIPGMTESRRYQRTPPPPPPPMR